MFDYLSSYLERLLQCLPLPCSIYSYTMYGIVHVVYLSLIVKQAMSINSIRTYVEYSTVQQYVRLSIIFTVLCVCLTFISPVWLVFIMQITEETFQTLLDRVATTKDFSTVRDNVLFFLQVSTTTRHPSLLSDSYSYTCHNNSRLIYQSYSSENTLRYVYPFYDTSAIYPVRSNNHILSYQCYLN